MGEENTLEKILEEIKAIIETGEPENRLAFFDKTKQLR